jgi:hypothetical protein
MLLLSLKLIFFTSSRSVFFLPKSYALGRSSEEVDTHEAVIFVPFLIRGLALPVSPFFHGLLDF